MLTLLKLRVSNLRVNYLVSKPARNILPINSLAQNTIVRYGQHDDVTLHYLAHGTGRPLKEYQYLKIKYILNAARVTLVTNTNKFLRKMRGFGRLAGLHEA